MARGPLNFRQRDVTAAVKAVKKAGENVARVEVDGEGKIIIYVGATNMVATNEAVETWDAKIRRHLARPR
jgi:hypothetical protein